METANIINLIAIVMTDDKEEEEEEASLAQEGNKNLRIFPYARCLATSLTTFVIRPEGASLIVTWCKMLLLLLLLLLQSHLSSHLQSTAATSSLYAVFISDG